MSNRYDELLRTDTGPQPVASNPYDELVLQGAEADRNALTAASLEVAGQAPEQVAAGLELARDRGVPPAVALSNREVLEAERQRDRMDRLLRESPIVARWASVPENMGLAQDDLENLARLDAVAAANRQYQQDVPFTDRVSARIKEGWLGLRAAFEGLLTAEAIKRGAEAGATGDFQMGFDPAGNPIYASEIFLFGDHLEQVASATEAQGDAAAQALAEGVAPIHAEMAKLPRRPATQALLESKSFGDTWRAFALDPLGVIGDLGVTSTVQQLPALAVTVATRNPGMAALAAAGNSGALEMGNGVVAYLGQQGVDTTDANAIVAALQDDQVAQRAVAYAQTRAGIVASFDAAAGGLASKVIIPARVVSSQPARETLNTFVAQPTLQMLLGGTGEATAQLATEGDIRAGEVFAEAAGELFTAPVEAGTFAFDRYRQRATERAANVEQSAVDQARVNAVTEVAASLKTSDRSPEAVEALVRQMREAGQDVPEAVYIDAEQARTYFQQQGLDPQKEMADLVGDAGRATEALALGGDLVVPFERWVARAAKSPHKDALQRLARFDPERLSADELASLDIDALLAEVYADPARGDEAAARAQASAADADPVQEVYMDVLGQLLGAGVERSAAEAQAQFLAQRYATRAERRGLGETAMDVYRLSGLSIEREGLGEEVLRQRPAEVDLDLDPVIDALRTGRVPTDQDIYGPSLVSALVAAGGIRPDSMGAADLRAQDATRQRPGLLNRNGMTLDDAVVWAWENGFLDRPPSQMLDAYDDEAPDLNTLLNLIVDELGGRPTFARRNENPDRARLRRAADELGTLLSEAGLPLEDLTNEQVRQFLLDGTRPQMRRVELSDDPEVDGVVYVNDRNGALIGTVVVEDNPEGLQIRGVELSADMRGQGLGVEVYERLAERAFAAGKPLLSDDTEISQDAVRVWEALERRGYAIERGETAEGVPTFRAVAPPEGVSLAADDALGAARGGERVFEQAQTRPFFSALTRAVESSKQAKAPAAQWAGLLRNMPGVRQEEIEWSGVLEWLGKQSGSVTREQVVDYLRANELQVEEAVLGDPQTNRPAPFSNLTIPGGSDYRVMLIKLPAADDYHTAWRKWAQARGLSDLDSEAEFQRETGRTANDRPNFTDGHWSDPNVVAHVRFDTRTDADGKKVLFVQELQSDWHQAGRKAGYGERNVDGLITGVPDAPFKTSWPELAMKRMVRYAAENGFDRIAWPTPDLVPQIEGWGTNLEQIKSDPALSKRFGAIIDRYARDLPRIGKDLARRLGGKLVATKFEAARKGSMFVPPPDLVQAGPDEMAAYSGAENFADGSPPMVGQTQIVVDGVIASAEVVVAGNGISLTWSSENEAIGFNSATVFWEDFAPRDPQTGSFGGVAFMDAWNRSPDNRSSLWAAFEDVGYKVRPVAKADVDVPAIEITPEMRETVMAGLPLFQRGGGGRRPVDVQRGRIEFRSDGSARIVLTKDANLSTFLHETGHLWLDELIVDATTEGTDPQLAADLDRVLAWMGVEARAADGRDAILRAIGTEHHESWARGFEAYLREGRAPSPALRDIFARFRAWLVRLYKDITQLRVELSPEVREVMGRLIATDDEIAAAEAQDSFVALAASEAEAAELGMSPDEFRAYAEARERATAEAREQVEQDLLAAWEREAKAEYQAELQRMREAVEEEVNAEPVYRAMLELQRKDGPKLNKAELVDRYGAAFLARLPGPGGDRANRGPYIYTLSGGLGLDEAGFLFGFNSGDALVQALVNAKSRKDTIEALARERMAQFYPDPLLDGSLAERAQKAVHAGARMDVLDRELRVLARKAGVRPTQARVIAEVARQMIGRRQVRELRPREFLVAERRAAREALQAVSARQFPAAHRAKFRQALNARLYAEALAAQERVEKDRRYLQRFDKKSKREALGKAGNGYLEQIDLILDQLDLRRISGAEIDRNAALRQMDEAIADGRLVVPPDVRARVEAARRTNWRELTVDELGAMVDAVRQIDTLARRELEIVLEGERRQLEADALEVADSVLLNGDYVAPALGTKSGRERIARWGKEALAVWLRPSAIARMADGGKDRGPVTRLIIEPLRRAVTERLEPMKVQAQKDLAELYQRFYSRAELVRMSRFREHLPEIGQHWTRFDLLSLALNWGNAGNRQAVLESVANGQQLFTEAGVQQALSRLSVRDWEFVQAVWDYIDGYWPQIAEAQRRRTGLAPEKVEAAPFTIRTADGQEIEVRGGYYPLVYDRDTDANTKLDDLEDAFKRIMNGRNVKAATARGHTIERVGSGRRPVRFGINVLHGHLNQVIHDLALGDAVDYVYKVLNYGNVKAAFSQVGKLEDWKALNIWLKDAAAGELAARNVLDMGFRWLRLGFTKSKLGFNIITALLQPTGLLQSAVVVGKANMIRGLMEFAARPVAAYRQVMEASAFMRARYELNAWNKDVQDSMDALRGKFGLVPSWVGPAMFLMITQTQKAVDVTTWVAAYRVGLEEYDGDHGQAVAYADGVVENAQTSGFFSDRSAIERGSLSDTARQSEFVRSWTTLISYMLAKGNIAFERAKSTNYRSIPQVANLAADLALLFTFEALLAAVIRGTWPEDDEDWWWWLAAETAGSVASTIPFVREVPSGLKGFEVTGTPQAAFLNDIGKAATQIQQGEVDAALLKAANNVGGTLFHYPSAQMNRAIDAYWREEVEGEDVAPYEYITGRRDRQ